MLPLMVPPRTVALLYQSRRPTIALAFSVSAPVPTSMLAALRNNWLVPDTLIVPPLAPTVMACVVSTLGAAVVAVVRKVPPFKLTAAPLAPRLLLVPAARFAIETTPA